MKKILAACYDRYLEFDTEQEQCDYLDNLKERKQTIRILKQCMFNGKYRIRLQVRYNGSPMYHELSEDYACSEAMEQENSDNRYDKEVS